MSKSRKPTRTDDNVTYVQFGDASTQQVATTRPVLSPIERPSEIRGTAFQGPEQAKVAETFESAFEGFLDQSFRSAWSVSVPTSIALEGKTLFSDFAVSNCTIRSGRINATVDDGWHRIVDVQLDSVAASELYSAINRKNSAYAQFFVQVLSPVTRDVMAEVCAPLSSATWTCSCALAQTQPVCPHMVAVELYLKDRILTNPWELIRMTVNTDVGTTFGTLKRIAQQHMVAGTAHSSSAQRSDDEELVRALPELPSVTLPPAIFAGQSDYLLSALTHVTRGTREALNVRYWLEEFYHTLETKPPLIDPHGKDEGE